MQAQINFGNPAQATRLNWLPQRPCMHRRSLRVNATSGAAPPPATKEVPKDIVTRQYRRTVYDFSLWAKHRDVNRYLYNLKTIPGSRIIRTLSQPMGVVLAWATLFGFYETCLESGVLPTYLPQLTLTSAEPQGLTSFALSLLLVFRTNSSYGRFDEARKIWGGILNRARNIANQAVTFIPADDAAGREAVGKWTVGFCRALQAHLQEDADLRAELQKAQPRWTQQEIDILCSAQHRPIKAISMLSELTRQLSITEFQALQMQENVTFFYDALGGCERLLRTPIPVSYTRHTARFLTIWLSLLPLGLWERYHWSMLPVIALIGFLLLGIDEIGISIEEPFGILPLDVICTRAQTDVVSLIKDDPAVANYIADVRQGRIAPPAEPVAAAPVAAAAAAASTPVVVASVASVGRSGSPTAQQPGVMQTMSSLITNVKAGIGAVAPAPQRTPSPSASPRARSPRGVSPSRQNSFPRASAGTGMAPLPPPIMPPTPVANGSNGSGKAAAVAAAAAPPPAVSGAGFTMSFSGLVDGAASAAKSASAAAAKFSKLADSVTAGTPRPSAAQAATVVEVSAVPAAAAAPKPPKVVREEVSAATPPDLPHAAAAANPSSPAAPSTSSSTNSSSNGRSSSDRRAAVNWREELEALRATREVVDPDAPSYGSGSGFSLPADGMDSDDPEDEALRRFGGLAGRSRGGTTVAAAPRSNGNGNSYSNGNGNGTVEVRSGRPRTRSDWRNQL
ncbi:hypothetical protein Vretimale_6511 [Volvox reticuliferus]|uniref:Uncharacterized protein n=2 Tax=Volvox reticuliferus TaxID=1737510 RepID=A0A8J4LKP5_9CHLO|nr:hypothetical protein Vretifemale_7328 [Volvox reticuliferus]GIM01806.1 hypothetical protein Vretimale_6511 [Volvox reticuliferus]